ncbi:MAG: hypothetical protein WC805_03235 [Patescibacteria group bacterium]|jgi:hypothetical protein
MNKVAVLGSVGQTDDLEKHIQRWLDKHPNATIVAISQIACGEPISGSIHTYTTIIYKDDQ